MPRLVVKSPHLLGQCRQDGGLVGLFQLLAAHYGDGHWQVADVHFPSLVRVTTTSSSFRSQPRLSAGADSILPGRAILIKIAVKIFYSSFIYGSFKVIQKEESVYDW